QPLTDWWQLQGGRVSGHRGVPAAFALTTAEAVLPGRALAGPAAGSVPAETPAPVTLAIAVRPSPRGDDLPGELSWLGTVVECLRHDAANQRCILAAFEEQSWAQRIA